MKPTAQILRTISLFLLVIGTLISCRELNTTKVQEPAKTTYHTNGPAVVQEAAKTSYNIKGNTVNFKGIITDAKNDCWSDGICSIEVDNKWWITIEEGLSAERLVPKERGTSTGVRFTKDNESVGKKVAVYAQIKNNNQLTLEGRPLYYVKIIE